MLRNNRLWLNLYLENCEKNNKSVHTINNYRSDLTSYIKWFEFSSKKAVIYTGQNDIILYQDYLKGTPTPVYVNFLIRILSIVFKGFRSNKKIERNPLSVGSQKRALSSLKNYFEFLSQIDRKDLRKFKNNPVKTKLHHIKLKDIDIKHTKLITPNQWYQLERSLIHPKDFLACYLLYFGGLRLEELTRLDITSFSTRTKAVSLVRKGGQMHDLKLNHFDQIFDVLKQYLETRKIDSDKLFLNKFGTPMSTRSMHKYINKIFEKAQLDGLGLTAHSFRKACATNLYKDSKDILLVRNYLNHKDAKVTQTYIEY